jgi:NitT/TauT family transport system permease protein
MGNRLHRTVETSDLGTATISRCSGSLGVAWIVAVAAEMIAVNSGLGFLIIDARNAGNR